MAFQILNTPFLIYAEDAVEFNLGEVRYVPRSVDAAEDAISCEALSVPVEPPLEGDMADVWNTWEPNINTWQARTDTWENLTGHVSITGNEPSDATHEFTITYDATSPEYYKGVVLVQGKTQNLSNFMSGNLTFEIYVESYGEPANPGETPSDQIVVKMESTAGSGNDYPLGYLAPAQWHAISVPVAELNTGALDITKVNTPFATLPTGMPRKPCGLPHPQYCA